jgi:hypothetical protein
MKLGKILFLELIAQMLFLIPEIEPQLEINHYPYD